MKLTRIGVCLVAGCLPFAAALAGDAILGDWEATWVKGVERSTYSPIELTFKAEQVGGYVHGSGGCNRVTRRFELKDGKVLLTGPMTSTRMYCGGVKHAIERVVLRLLGHETGWSVEGGKLVLRAADNSRVADFSRVVPLRLPK